MKTIMNIIVVLAIVALIFTINHEIKRHFEIIRAKQMKDLPEEKIKAIEAYEKNS